MWSTTGLTPILHHWHYSSVFSATILKGGLAVALCTPPSQGVLCGSPVVAKRLKGKTMSVFMPLEVNGSVKNYSFEFLVSNVQ
jgi:hypothetical protein